MSEHESKDPTRRRSGVVPPGDQERRSGVVPPGDQEGRSGVVPPGDQERRSGVVPPGDQEGRSGVVPGSGDAAVAAAAARAASTRERNIADAPELPIPADTANVRLGPEIHPDCLSLLPLVGVWRGTGSYGNEPLADDGATGAHPDFGQQIVVSHDGRPFLRFESIVWNLPPAIRSDDDPMPASREVGWLRPQPDGSIELLLAHAEGRVEVFYGQARSLTAWALSTDGVLRTPTATPVIGATRLYGITADGRLAYVEERAHTDAELAPHSSALLERLVG
ncbi:FABP family protein [Nakamurella lactea]|uniref:FABP family protein n=1 Tax=Nakamurella lactea TaxID=459515 RepID=UPI000A00C3E2|nr:FABP family protein [Nakamurella lactea]